MITEWRRSKIGQIFWLNMSAYPGGPRPPRCFQNSVDSGELLWSKAYGVRPLKSARTNSEQTFSRPTRSPGVLDFASVRQTVRQKYTASRELFAEFTFLLGLSWRWTSLLQRSVGYLPGRSSAEVHQSTLKSDNVRDGRSPPWYAPQHDIYIACLTLCIAFSPWASCTQSTTDLARNDLAWSPIYRA